MVDRINLVENCGRNSSCKINFVKQKQSLPSRMANKHVSQWWTLNINIKMLNIHSNWISIWLLVIILVIEMSKIHQAPKCKNYIIIICEFIVNWNVCVSRAANVKIKKVGVSHSVSRENPNSNAVRGSASSAIRNSLSSFSIYLFATILINILFIQCSFWFRLFEWRRYDGLMQIISCINVSSPITTIIQSLTDITCNLDRYFSRNSFELVTSLCLCTRILSKQFLLNYFSVVFIGVSNLIVYKVLLFAQNNLFGVTAVLSSFTTNATKATTILTKKPNFKLIATQFHHSLKQCTEMLKAIFDDNDYTTYTNTNDNNLTFKGVINNKFNLDYEKPFFRAANHLTESQTHSTDQL